MKNKVKFLIKNSLVKKATSKQFIISNIILAIILIAIVNVDSIIKFFGGDFSEEQKIVVVDNINAYDAFVNKLSAYSNSSISVDGSGYNISKGNYDVDSAKEYVKDHNGEWVIIFDHSDENIMKTYLISQSFIGATDYAILSSAINSIKQEIAIKESGIDLATLELISSDADIERVILDEDKASDDEYMAMIVTSIFPVVILPIFMLILFLVQMISSEINDEKTNRGMEIIIGNVSPTGHFVSKIVACNLFTFYQAILLFIYSGIGICIKFLLTGSANINVEDSSIIGEVVSVFNNAAIKEQISNALPYTVILVLLTFIAYSLIAGILASVTTTAEDLQQMQTPMMMTLLLGYYLAIMAGIFKGSIVVKIISYIPLISAILAPSLLVMGDIGVIDILISIGLLLLFIYVMIKYGMNVYKDGILNYSSNDLWKKVLKSFKRA